MEDQPNVPNATAVEAMNDLEEGRGQAFDSLEALFRDLGV